MGSVPSTMSHQQIQAAGVSGVLDLSNRGLPEVPKQVFNVAPNMRLLDLSANHLLRVPAAIQTLTNLKSLYLNQV